ncbi:hypothetical protein [Halovivax gelatinilyticus]|uniref:hypothetical protein n=1 Tax=Halovivax gelatinilyticus TaxID=2961597 RepID=UPI0020CA8CF1|nr:hypothetical protein [Halovivax gelatinilyticus]
MNEDSNERYPATLFDRRTYLKAALSATGVAALAMNGAASNDDYDVIEVGPGETYTKRLSAGETWENKIIDITADGAGYAIRCHRNDTTIRNVGVRGLWDHEPSSSPFTVRAPSSSGKIRIENIHLPGAESPGYHSWGNPTGIYVHNDHAGDLEIRNAYIAQMPDNGIYASDPGSPPGHPSTGDGGTVRIYDSYIENCGWNFRLGSDGSYCNNCISVLDGPQQKGTPRAFRDYFSAGVEFINCDVYAPEYVGWNNGSGTWSNTFSCSQLTLDNCRANVSRTVDGSCSSYVRGSPSGNPRTDPADVGAPTSAEAAASGRAAGEEPEPEPEFPEDAHLVAFVTEPDAELAEYELAVDGELIPTEAPYESPSGGRIAAHRETVEEEDGLSTVASLSGGGHGDAYEVHGPVQAVSVDQPDVMWIELNGERVSEEELVERTSGDDEDEPDEPPEANLVAFVTEPDAELAEYELAVEGELVPTEAPYESPSGGRIAAHRETVEEEDGLSTVASLSGGGHGDAYEVHGPVQAVSVDQPDVMWIELNGERVSEEELVERTSGDDEDEPDEPPEANLVAFVTEPDAELAEYELAVEGELVPTEAPYESPSGGRIAAHRETVEEEDGLSTVASLSGGGHGDAYEVHGPVQAVSVDQPDAMWIELDGEEVSEEELIERTGGDLEGENADESEEDHGPHRLEVAGQFAYRIEVSGDIQPAEAHARWLTEGEAYGDDWAEWWLSGSDEARTVWEFTGEITSLEIDDHDGETEIRTLAVDGEELDHP